MLILLPLSLLANPLLSEKQIPNLIDILPPPPNKQSIIYTNDIITSEKSFSINKQNKRYKLATTDAVWSTDGFAYSFSKAFGYHIDKENTPQVYNIIRQVLKYSDATTTSIKRFYKRKRPFATLNKKSCTPKTQNNMGYAYPSGHTTAVWALALILSEINPQRQKQLLQRVYSFGQSRVVCGVNWESDVQFGYISGSILFETMISNGRFKEEI